MAFLLCSCGRKDSYPTFGFEAYYEIPPEKPGPDEGYGCFLTSTPVVEPWIGGPHMAFDRIDLAQVARESLAWFEESRETASWRTNETARLELSYPSDSTTITARYVPGSGLSWEHQLRTWIGRFPPRGDGALEPGGESYTWSIAFAAGEVHGNSPSDAAALEAMKSRLGDPSPLFRNPYFQLSFLVRRMSHEMDCYVQAGSVDKLDELPRLVREKRAQYGER